MQERLQQIVAEARQGAGELTTRGDFEAFKARITGPKGSLTDAMKGIKALPNAEKPAAGKLINQTKQELEAIFAEAVARIEAAEAEKRLGPAVDTTLPAPDFETGQLHPLTQTRERIREIFRKAGFTVAEGAEVETEFFCFDALNTPPDHPARDPLDTYYLPQNARMGNVSKRGDEQYLLRTHTSTVQIRTMLETQPPLRIISPGRCFRRDTADATHSANFHQIEGLYVDRQVTVADLKAVLDYFFKELLGKDARTRFRPHFFPYTEPSFEVDLYSDKIGKLSGRWIEIMGCGMVDPTVFEAVGYPEGEWTGYAFGMGIERLAMMLYGVDDIRYFYQNDARFLRQFA
ncbi:MAG: phenylalanine--tRNA ligase subunit alpha [Verrucomicrobiota bacterium]